MRLAPGARSPHQHESKCVAKLLTPMRALDIADVDVVENARS